MGEPHVQQCLRCGVMARAIVDVSMLGCCTHGPSNSRLSALGCTLAESRKCFLNTFGRLSKASRDSVSLCGPQTVSQHDENKIPLAFGGLDLRTITRKYVTGKYSVTSCSPSSMALCLTSTECHSLAAVANTSFLVVVFSLEGRSLEARPPPRTTPGHNVELLWRADSIPPHFLLAPPAISSLKPVWEVKE